MNTAAIEKNCVYPELESFIERLIQENENFDRELKFLKRSPSYNKVMLKKMSDLEVKIKGNENKIKEVEIARKFLPNSWVVRYGNNRPGKVFDAELTGRIVSIQVVWDGAIVPVPERPVRLELINDDRCKYIWNGDRHSKLIRQIDGRECDDIDILSTHLNELQRQLNDDFPDEWKEEMKLRLSYCRKRIELFELKELSRLESVVEQGLKVFYQVGEALAEICDRQLYKQQGYTDFRVYLKERWKMSKSKAYRLIDAAEVMNKLKSVPHGGQLPDNERVTRELAKAAPEDQIGVWQVALETSETGSPTAKEVREIVQDSHNQDSNSTDKPSTSAISFTDKGSQDPNFPLPPNAKQLSIQSLTRSELAEQFEIGQLVKLELAHFEGASERLKLANHSYSQITALTENRCSLKIDVLGHSSFVVSPEDIKPVESVSFAVDFTPKQFIALMSIHKTRVAIEKAIRQGVLGN
ncbi:MAG: hypothetical protein AAFQ41_02335 [Cyanobacteria bacterium J06623_7]